MAYLDLHNLYQTPARTAAPGPVPEPAGFSALEWSVVVLARRDPLRSLGQPGRVARAMGSLFGLAATSRLADPRLEALRRIAVYVWHHGFAVPLPEIDRFAAAGFTATQLETLVASETGVRVGE